MNDARPAYDRGAEDVGNIVEFGHVNLAVPDQRLATIFYIVGLGLTRDPYLVVGVDNMWVNAGTAQFHLPNGRPQLLRGRIGLVVPDLEALMRRLARVRQHLAGTKFDCLPAGDTVDITCPWGNRIRCHAPDPRRFGRITLGMPYVEIDAAPGTAAGIARFYRDIIGTPASTGEDAEGVFARLRAGPAVTLTYRETARELPAFDGHHIQISLADFSGPHGRLDRRGLITAENNQSQYRFVSLVDPESNAELGRIEHEVRSMCHPLYGRPLVNRNPDTTNNRYAPGHEARAWAMPPE